MKLIFEGLVEIGDGCRVGLEENDGAIIIGDRDVVSEIEKSFEPKTKIVVGIADETFDGDLFVEYGWGYSEFTPMESDRLQIGDHDLISILDNYANQIIKMWVSDEPINVLD